MLSQAIEARLLLFILNMSCCGLIVSQIPFCMGNEYALVDSLESATWALIEATFKYTISKMYVKCVSDCRELL